MLYVGRPGTSRPSERSQILEAIRQGEEYQILDRRVPIARLVPVTPALEGTKGTLPPWLERRRRAGTIRVGTLRSVPEILNGFPPGTGSLGNAAVDAILEERRSDR